MQTHDTKYYRKWNANGTPKYAHTRNNNGHSTDSNNIMTCFPQMRKENTKLETGFVLVVWSLTLENNRRIITLSSAVSIASPDCGIPIEIGVKQSRNEIVKGARDF